MSYADKVFIENCKDILENGTSTEGELVRPHWEDGTPAYTIKQFGIINRYDLSKEFPALTLRKVPLKSALDEILWIYQKKSNITEYLSSSVWDSWTKPITNQNELVYISPPNINDLFFEIKKINPIINYNPSDIKQSKKCGPYIKIEDVGFNKVKIQFIDTGNIKTISKQSYYRGQIFDEYKINTYGIGYYGNHKKPELKEYFGKYFNRWVDIWRHICKRCSPANQLDAYKNCLISTNFRNCEYFLTWVKNNNRYGKEYLGVLQVDKDYYGVKCYSEKTCTLLTPKENISLTLKNWFYYNKKYYYSREDLIKQLEKDSGKSFISYNNSGDRVGIKPSFNNYLQEMIDKKEIQVIYPNKLINGKYPRFPLKTQNSIGTCYGWVIGNKFPFKGEMIDQTDYVLKQLKETPFSRRIMTNMYQYQYLSGGGLDPCCYSMTYNVTEKNGKRYLNAILNQRSQDMLAANGWNICQYSLLLMMMAQVNNMIPGEIVHVIADCHIYDRHIPIIKELIIRPQYEAPIVKFNPAIKNFYDFTVDDLIIENYNTNPQIKNIPIAI